MDKQFNRHLLRLRAEQLRRKGLSIKDAQLLPTQPDPWYLALSWNDAEEQSFKRFFFAFNERNLGLDQRDNEREWLWWCLASGLHRRDTCGIPRHAHVEERDADLPRSRWLPVRAAMVTMPEDQWPR